MKTMKTKPWTMLLVGRKYYPMQDIDALQILNLGLRELPICTKICTKASAFVLLPLCLGSAFVS